MPVDLDEAFPEGAQALGILQQLSRLDAASIAAGPRTPDPSLFRRIADASDPDDAITVPPVASPATGLDQIQRHRLSVRYFADRAVPAGVVSAIAAAASAFDATAWPGSPLQLLVAARDVDGLSPAIYAYEAGVFRPAGPLPLGDASADLVLQVEFADSPAILLVCGSLATELDTHGEHGHRLLLSRAGAAAYAGWLTAMDHGLTGSIFAGFLATSLRPLVPVDGFHTTQLIALAVGHAQDMHRS